MQTEETRKQKKPRRAAEILDTQRRYLVRTNDGAIRVVEANSKEQAKEPYRYSHPVAGLMGTDETEKQAIKRLSI